VPRIHRTPVLRSTTLDARCGAELFFKCENLQKTGSFKIRGATNAIFSLSDEEASRGIVDAFERQSCGSGFLCGGVARNSGMDCDAEECACGEMQGCRSVMAGKLLFANRKYRQEMKPQRAYKQKPAR